MDFWKVLAYTLWLGMLLSGCGLHMEPTGSECHWDADSGTYGYWDCGGRGMNRGPSGSRQP